MVGFLVNADLQGLGRRGEHRDASVPHRGQNRGQLSIESASPEVESGRRSPTFLIQGALLSPMFSPKKSEPSPFTSVLFPAVRPGQLRWEKTH